MSNHICTRWYRPPEAILLEKDYDEQVDIWSAGCVLSELIYCQDVYIAKGASPKDRYLFRGDSCFPLSPFKQKDGSKEENVSKDDQLRVILKTLGKQKNKDLSYITDFNAHKYATELRSTDRKINFEKEFPLTNASIARVLQNMLEFNPYFR